MKIDVRQAGDITILDCSGKITLAEGTSAIRTKIREVLKNGGKKIVLNLAEVNYIDSSGLGELISSYSSIREENAQVRLLNLLPKIDELLTITKIKNSFQVFSDEAQAIASFANTETATKLEQPIIAVQNVLVILNCAGEFVKDNLPDKICANLDGLFREPGTIVILDLSKAKFTSACDLKVLCDWHELATTRKGVLWVVLNDAGSRLQRICGLTAEINVASHIEAVLAKYNIRSFGKD